MYYINMFEPLISKLNEIDNNIAEIIRNFIFSKYGYAKKTSEYNGKYLSHDQLYLLCIGTGHDVYDTTSIDFELLHWQMVKLIDLLLLFHDYLYTIKSDTMKEFSEIIVIGSKNSTLMNCLIYELSMNEFNKYAFFAHLIQLGLERLVDFLTRSESICINRYTLVVKIHKKTMQQIQSRQICKIKFSLFFQSNCNCVNAHLLNNEYIIQQIALFL